MPCCLQEPRDREQCQRVLHLANGGGAERRSRRIKIKIAVGLRMMREEGGTARVGARCLTLVSGCFASG